MKETLQLVRKHLDALRSKMAATGIGNASGAQVVFDGGCPRIITGYAKETISGGVFVFASGAADVVSSDASTYITSDIQFAKDASGLQFNGIALATAGSNTPISVMTRGVFILQASATVTAGYPVMCDGSNAVEDGAANAAIHIGRALTSATSGNFCLVDIRA